MPDPTGSQARGTPAPGRMRAVRRDGAAVVCDAGTPRPVPDPARDALIAVRKVAINEIDRAVARGDLDARSVLGQAFVGTVESAPTGRGFDRGSRVTALPDLACGACDLCRSGLSRHCRERRTLGLRDCDGCLAESVVVPVHGLVAIPARVDDDHAVFAMHVGAAVEASRRITIEGKPYITVLGDGVVGLIVVQVLARLNASVRLIGWHPDRLALCEKWGIKHRHVDDIGRRADQDVVVDCSGRGAALEIAFGLARPRGTILLHQAPHRDTPGLAPLVDHELTLIGFGAGSLVEALRLLDRREVDVVSLVSRRIRLEDAPAALRQPDRPEVIQVLVDV
ncbi:MAG: alcohol dehydrogenase catalytic domain-containing protein [Phycisphaerales bacterium]|nr:alcohol dehydrogenase catalytic domain-containing protein [Phycisphaerales bacterium]